MATHNTLTLWSVFVNVQLHTQSGPKHVQLGMLQLQQQNISNTTVLYVYRQYTFKIKKQHHNRCMGT